MKSEGFGGGGLCYTHGWHQNLVKGMPHLHQSIKCMLTSYDIILAHFEHVSQAASGKATAEVKGRAHFVSHKMRDFRVLRYMFFMQDLLEIISTLGLKMQANAATC